MKPVDWIFGKAHAVFNGKIECVRLRRLGATQLNPFFSDIADSFEIKITVKDRLMIQDQYDIARLVGGSVYDATEKMWLGTTNRVFNRLDELLTQYEN